MADNDEWRDGHVSRLTIDIARSTQFLRELDPMSHETLSRSMHQMHLVDAEALGLDHLDWVFTGDGWDVWSGSEGDRLPLAAFALAFLARFGERLERNIKAPNLKDMTKPGLRIALYSGSERRPPVEKGPMDWLSDAAVQAARARDVCDPDSRPFVINQGAYEAVLRLFTCTLIEATEVEASCKHGETPGALYAVGGVRDVTREVIQQPDETPDWLRPIEYVLRAQNDPAAEQVQTALHDKAREVIDANAPTSPKRRAKSSQAAAGGKPDPRALRDLVSYAATDQEARLAYQDARDASVELPASVFRRRIDAAKTATEAAFWLKAMQATHGSADEGFGRHGSEAAQVFGKARSADEAIAVANDFHNKSALGPRAFSAALYTVETVDDAVTLLNAASAFGLDADGPSLRLIMLAIMRLRDDGRYAAMAAIADGLALYAGDAAPADPDAWQRVAVFFGAQALDYLGRSTEALDRLRAEDWSRAPEENAGYVSSFDARHLEAQLLDKVGRSAEALEAVEALLPEFERVSGAAHPDTLTTRFLRAQLLDKVGRSAEALEAVEVLLPERERVSDAAHPDTFPTRYLRAHLLDEVGRSAEALEAVEALLPEFERVRGAEHPDTLTTRHLRAHLLDKVGRSAEALEAVEALLPEWERVIGAEHPHTLTTRSLRALLLDKVGRSAEALEAVEALLPEWERVSGAKHPYTLTTKRLRAEILGSLDRLEEAEAEAEQALARFVAAGDPAPELAQRTRIVLAEIKAKRGKRAEAEPLVRTAVDWYRERVLPEEVWRRRGEVLLAELGGDDGASAA
jgi:tetratricopeptide (TPR) repeat protein